jgi:hypothetical protein
VKAGEEPDPSLREGDLTKAEYESNRVIPAGERLDSAIKDSRMGTSPSGTNGIGAATGGGKEKTLDDWLAEGEDEEGETEEEDETEDDDDEAEDESEEQSSGEASDAEEESSDENEHDRLVK